MIKCTLQSCVAIESNRRIDVLLLPCVIQWSQKTKGCVCVSLGIMGLMSINWQMCQLSWHFYWDVWGAKWCSRSAATGRWHTARRHWRSCPAGSAVPEVRRGARRTGRRWRRRCTCSAWGGKPSILAHGPGCLWRAAFRWKGLEIGSLHSCTHKQQNFTHADRNVFIFSKQSTQA